MAGIAGISSGLGHMRDGSYGCHANILTLVTSPAAVVANNYTRMIPISLVETTRKRIVTVPAAVGRRSPIGCQWNVVVGVTDYVRISYRRQTGTRRAAMASVASANQACVIHAPTHECTGIGVAGFTWLGGWKVSARPGHGLIHHPQILPTMTTDAVASHSQVVITLDLEARGTDMTRIAFIFCRDMVDRLRLCSDASTDGVATRTYFWRILENALDVALFAFQGAVYIL